MNWASASDFLDMGGHALYVWGAYALTAAACCWELTMLTQRRRRAQDEARDRAHNTPSSTRRHDAA